MSPVHKNKQPSFFTASRIFNTLGGRRGLKLIGRGASGNFSILESDFFDETLSIDCMSFALSWNWGSISDGGNGEYGFCYMEREDNAGYRTAGP